MASWGEFIREVPILNKKSEGIFVKVDHVIDLWEERNKLRLELEQLRAGGAAAPVEAAPAEAVPSPAPAAEHSEPTADAIAERERCASEIEAFAETYCADPELRPLTIEVLHAAAQHLREKQGDDLSDFLAGVEIPPSAVAAPSAETVDEAVPMAEALPDSGDSLPS